MNHRAPWTPLAAAVVVVALLAQPTAQAEPRRTAPAKSFSSGAMRSEQILREIATTLRSIDARIARVESAVDRLSAKIGDNRVP